MEILFYNPIINGLVIIILGILMTPIMRYLQTVRLLIALYISLSLTLIMPDRFLSDAYMQGIIFLVMVILAIAAVYRLCETEGRWAGGYFDVYMCGSSVLVIVFFIAIMCFILPPAFMQTWVAVDVYDLLVNNIFYISVVPLIYHVLFFNHLR
jgi:hypothetical protein